MSTARPLLPTLLPDLNALLAALELPFTLQHPTDLTPSLLLALFESLISARLPIPNAIRQSRTGDAKARAMLVLLGVLECDILRGGTDDNDDSVLAGAGGVSVDGWADEIGLGEVDPERLADGGWEETIFIGELLCWLARRKGVLPRSKSSHRARSLYLNYHDDSADLSTSLLLRPSPADDDPDCSALSHITDVPRHPLVHSPEPSFSACTDLSIHARSVSSRTSVSNDDAMYNPQMMLDAEDEDEEDEDDRPPTFRPHCIHELDDPSYIRALHEEDGQDEQDNDDLYAPPTPTPRRARLTDPLDELDHRSRRSVESPSQIYTRILRSKTDVLPRPRRTPRRISPSPSPSPSPPLPTRTSKHPPASPSPSPPPTHSESPFDISFSTLNNTSTPAKPRPRRPQFQPQTSTSTGSVGGRLRVPHPRERNRSPSYTPSPPSFSASTPSRPRGTPTSALKPSTSFGGLIPSTTRSAGAALPPARVNESATTAMTNTLLTERARLLTELAALKRARAVSGGGGGTRRNGRAGVGV